MLLKMKIPCHNCICVAVCKHKSFNDLMEACSLIKYSIWCDDLTPGGRLKQGHEETVRRIIEILKPIKWGIRKNGSLETMSRGKPEK